MRESNTVNQIDEFTVENILSVEEKKILDSFTESFYQNIKKKYNLEDKKLKIVLSEKDENKNYIPASIFSIELGVSEGIVKFLHENRHLCFKDISNILQKSQSNVIVTYRKTQKKSPRLFTRISYNYKINLSAFSKDLTCLESACIYLKEHYLLNYHKIGQILDRDERTIWTVYHRASKKKGDKK
jgi:hypothetical protein